MLQDTQEPHVSILVARAGMEPIVLSNAIAGIAGSACTSQASVIVLLAGWEISARKHVRMESTDRIASTTASARIMPSAGRTMDIACVQRD